MIVRQFITWVRTAPAGERAEATRALARAWLHSDLSDDDRAAAQGALLMLLDDPSPLVRQVMAETFASSDDAPPTVIHSLAVDQPSVAAPVLEHSPQLIDADLIEIVAAGDPTAQCAIARRRIMQSTVAAALADMGCAEAVLELVENPASDIAPQSLERIADRFGDLAAIREALFARGDLPAALRHMLVAKLSETLSRFVASKNWIPAQRAARLTQESAERATITIAAAARGADLQGFVTHLRQTGQLNAGLILRALLSGNNDLFEAALVELSGLPAHRVAGIVQDGGATPLTALLSRAGLPETTFAAFRAAVEASRATGFVGTVEGRTRLHRHMVERVLTACEHDDEAIGPLMVLLRRFSAELAREEARLYCDELVQERGLLPTELIAA